MATIESRFARFHARSLEAAHVATAQSVLLWDQEVMMPKKGDAMRAGVLGTLAAIAHQRSTGPEYERAISDLMSDIDQLDERQAIALRLAWKRFQKAKRVPKTFVKELAELTAQAQAIWAQARKDSDFAAFRPTLERVVSMKRQEASFAEATDSPYDALLDEFEPGMTTAKAVAVLDDLCSFLVTFVKQIDAARSDVVPAIARFAAPLETQVQLERNLVTAMGFDLEAGRIDLSTHPFCTGFHPMDVRLTTRRNPNDALYSFYSVAHEAGHGLYEQGLPADQFGLPTGGYASMGLHESQSRLWENMVAKSEPFWQHLHQLLADQGLIADTLNHRQYWRAINDVTPSFIRTESDEVTYNLHVCLRFEIERDLIEGRLEVADVRDAWNAKMREYLGLTVQSDAQGVLQDVHWSGGYFGYFPSYTIGNLYSAQLFAAAARDIPGLEDGFAEWQFRPLLDWLRDKVHRHGSFLPADEIVRRATGTGLDAAPFKSYLERKYRRIYRFAP